MAGDFNAHNFDWLGSRNREGLPKTDNPGTACELMATSFGLTNVVTCATHDIVTWPKMFSCIDLVLTNSPSIISTSLSPPFGLSKHCVIEAQVDLTISRPPPPKRRVKQFSKANYSDMNTFLSSSSWTAPKGNTREEHLDNLVKVFYKNVEEAISEHVPSKMSGGARKKVWFTPACLKSLKASQHAFKQMKHSNRDHDRLKYKSAATAHRATIAAAKRSYRASQRAKLSSAKGSMKDWWKLVDQVLEKNYKPPIPGPMGWFRTAKTSPPTQPRRPC
jgi:hypothetical protein